MTTTLEGSRAAAPCQNARQSSSAVRDRFLGCLKKKPKHQESLHALERARALAKSKLPVTDAIADLGEGWVAEEALAIAAQIGRNGPVAVK